MDEEEEEVDKDEKKRARSYNRIMKKEGKGKYNR